MSSQPSPNELQPPNVSCDVLRLLDRYMNLISAIRHCESNAREAHDSGALAMLDYLGKRAYEEIDLLIRFSNGHTEDQRVKERLVDAWRHGESIPDSR